jgi:hypothetical protein
LSSRSAGFFFDRYFNIGVLFTAAVLGVIYIFLVPPWQHNDEPTKFEFAWLIANRPGMPQRGDYDQGMRREVAASMIEHGFFRNLGFQPNLISIHEPIWIGISQINSEPLYYYLASLPLRLFRSTDITFQLYSARFLSFILYLFTVWVVIRASHDLFPNDRLLAMSVPIFVALLPGFVDLMTAVNDDVGAVAFLSLFFYAIIRILKGGLNFTTIALLVASVLLCLFTKRTAWLAVPFGILVLYLGVFRVHKQKAVLVAVVLSALGVLLSFSWSSSTPAFFYTSNNQSLPVRSSSPDAPAGKQVIIMNSGSHRFHQALGTKASENLAGENVSLGLWAWASQPVDILFPQLRVNDGDILRASQLNLTNDPTFYSFSATVPEDTSWLVLSVIPNARGEGPELYFDCLLLVIGEYSPDTIPSPMDENCSQVIWGSEVHENYIRNASGERAWPIFSDSMASFLDSRFGFSVTNMWGVFDTQATWHYFYATSAHLFRTFWGKFGWGEVGLLGSKPYRLFLFLTAAAVIGWVLALRKGRRQLFTSIVLFLALAAAAQIVMTLFRGAGNWYNYVFTPTARYAYPSIFPIAVFLCAGWWSLVPEHWRSRKYHTLIIGLFFCLFLILNGWALVSISSFYN